MTTYSLDIHTPFPIWNQSVVPCPVLTVASWPAYRFLMRQARWSGIPISLRIFQFIVIHRVKGFQFQSSVNIWEGKSGRIVGSVPPLSFYPVLCWIPSSYQRALSPCSSSDQYSLTSRPESANTLRENLLQCVIASLPPSPSCLIMLWCLQIDVFKFYLEFLVIFVGSVSVLLASPSHL